MSAGQGPTVGVVGEPALTGAVEDAGAAATAGSAADVLAADPAWVVAVGEPALTALVRESVAVPVLAVDVEPGVPDVPRDGVADAVAAVTGGEAAETTRRTVAASVGGTRATTFLRDALLVTAEPARISEYAVRTGDHRVARFRADGVVVATPAGSAGYLGAAGGPVVEPGTGTLAAVPVAPFETDSDHWVLDDAAVSLRVHRDEHVVLVADGRECDRVPTDAAVELRPAGTLTLYALGGDWKNSNGRRTE